MKTILQAVKEKLTASGSTISDGLGGKGLTVSEAIDALEIEGGGVTPTGVLTVTANTGSEGIDVTQYAFVLPNVAAYLVTYDSNNGADETEYSAAANGDVVALPDGSGLTAPSGKTFGGWATDAAGQQPIATSTIQVSGDTTVYAVWNG